jgi:hypothetical protein
MLGFAYAIGFDVPIAAVDGREVRLPKGFVDEDKVTAALCGLRDYNWRSDLDRYRWFNWCIAEAQREVEALGVAAELWQPPPPPARRPAPPLVAGLSSKGGSVAQPSAPEPAVVWVGEDEWHVGGTHAVRGSGPSWYVVALPSHLVGWFPNHDQARAAAIEAARAARSRGVRPHSPVPFTHQHVVDRGGPGEMSATGRPAPKVITRRPQQ